MKHYRADTERGAVCEVDVSPETASDPSLYPTEAKAWNVLVKHVSSKWREAVTKKAKAVWALECATKEEQEAWCKMKSVVMQHEEHKRKRREDG